MKMLFAVLSLFILSCDSIQKEAEHVKGDTLQVSSSIPEESNVDSVSFKEEISIEPKAFISILPSGKWLDSMQSIYAEDDWNEVVFDNEHYRNQTEVYLKSKGYIEVRAPEDRIWKIKRPNGLLKMINSDTLSDKWGVIIFNENNDPIYYDGTEPDDDLKDF